MSLPIIILILVLLGLVVMVVTAPLREGQRDPGGVAGEGSPLEQRVASSENAIAREDDLEAAREAKYREIRDSELDFRTGKLSAEDFAAIDAQLRAEALVILDQLERLKPRDA